MGMPHPPTVVRGNFTLGFTKNSKVLCIDRNESCGSETMDPDSFFMQVFLDAYLWLKLTLTSFLQ